MKLRMGLALFISMLIIGCSKPLPKDKFIYAGEWQNKEMKLLILTDGTVAYKRWKSGVTTSVNGPLKEFQGNNFVVGVGPFSTTFEVSEPPHEIDGSWQMVVDGVRLTRAPE